LTAKAGAKAEAIAKAEADILDLSDVPSRCFSIGYRLKRNSDAFFTCGLQLKLKFKAERKLKRKQNLKLKLKLKVLLK
jgi:hypothetical protein